MPSLGGVILHRRTDACRRPGWPVRLAKCFQDPQARELNLYWEIAGGLEQIMAFQGAVGRSSARSNAPASPSASRTLSFNVRPQRIRVVAYELNVRVGSHEDTKIVGHKMFGAANLLLDKNLFSMPGIPQEPFNILIQIHLPALPVGAPLP